MQNAGKSGICCWKKFLLWNVKPKEYYFAEVNTVGWFGLLPQWIGLKLNLMKTVWSTASEPGLSVSFTHNTNQRDVFVLEKCTECLFQFEIHAKWISGTNVIMRQFRLRRCAFQCTRCLTGTNFIVKEFLRFFSALITSVKVSEPFVSYHEVILKEKT